MASKILTPAFRLSKIALPLVRPSTRAFQTSRRLLEVPSAALPLRQPIGAFRGGMFGFLLGSTIAGGTVYFYLFDEYKMSNELLLGDIYALQTAVQRLHDYVTTLEEKIDRWDTQKDSADGNGVGQQRGDRAKN